MKPDFSIIEPMACKCKDIPERDEILRQLKEWGVPIDEFNYDLNRCKLLRWAEIDGLEIQVSIWNYHFEEPEFSPSDFLSRFREVYEASQIPARPVDMHFVSSPVTAKGIVFPSDDVVLTELVRRCNPPLVKAAEFIEWYKWKILKLNQQQP